MKTRNECIENGLGFKEQLLIAGEDSEKVSYACNYSGFDCQYGSGAGKRRHLQRPTMIIQSELALNNIRIYERCD